MNNGDRIDIETILYRKTGKRIGPITGAILRRLIHQSELNDIWDSGRNMSAEDFLNHTLDYLKADLEIVSTGEIPADGRYLYVSNHPFGGLDGMMIVSELLKRHGDAGVIVNDLLMNIGPLRSLWIPVNVYGRQHRETGGEYAEAMASEKRQILTFPAGFCSRKIDGEVKDTQWKPRFVKDAMKYGRKIVPVYVEGRLSRLFYGIYSLRRKLHIKTNIELLLLVDEMFRQRGKHIRIVFGTPVDIRDIAGSAEEQCQQIREMVYNLKKHITTK